MDGYRTAGYFFVCLRDNKDPEFLRKFNRSTLEVMPWSFDGAIKHILGTEYSIDELWHEYQVAVGDVQAIIRINMVSKLGKKRLFLVWSCLVSILPGMAQTEKLIDYVNPFVGTDGYGNVYPGAQIPFGGIQMSPDTDSKYYDAASGYKYNHSTLLGFSLTHLSGTGIPDLGDFLFIPGTGEMKLDPGTREEPEKGYRSRYSHEKEWASPNYYAVELSDYGVKAEMTSGVRSGMFRFTYPQSDKAFIMIDMNHTFMAIL